MGKMIARIRFLAQEEGGRTQSLPPSTFGCPIFFEDIPELSAHGYDCRILLSEINRLIAPGDEVEAVRIVFLSPDEVFAHVRKGTTFSLWEGKVIARGEVVDIE